MAAVEEYIRIYILLKPDKITPTTTLQGVRLPLFWGNIQRYRVHFCI